MKVGTDPTEKYEEGYVEVLYRLDKKQARDMSDFSLDGYMRVGSLIPLLEVAYPYNILYMFSDPLYVGTQGIPRPIGRHDMLNVWSTKTHASFRNYTLAVIDLYKDGYLEYPHCAIQKESDLELGLLTLPHECTVERWADYQKRMNRKRQRHDG